MKKKLSLFLIMSAMMVSGGAVCHASIIPAQGPGQIGYSSVVLCDSLSLHADPAYDSQTVQTLKYGDRVIVMDTEDGWAHCTTGDAEDSPKGYVNEDFLIVDPAWYRTEGDTVVYAWNDTGAPKVALLDGDTTLPVLRDDGDWIVVSLRGAAGWIHDPVRTDSFAAESTSQTNSGSGADSGSSLIDMITVYDEFGGAYTLYESADGSWSDADGTVYDRLSDSEFQVHEGTKRLSVYYPSQDYDDEGADYGESGETAFTVYAEDGSTVVLHFIAGATYEDTNGRTYLKQDDDYYYCIPTDTTYALFPDMWTGEIYGENEFPEDTTY